jgi:hypothetical protein
MRNQWLDADVPVKCKQESNEYFAEPSLNLQFAEKGVFLLRLRHYKRVDFSAWFVNSFLDDCGNRKTTLVKISLALDKKRL